MLRPTHPARYWLLLVAFCFAASVAKAASAAGFDFPDPSPPTSLEGEMLADAVSGQFSRFSLIEAALVAGGVDRADLLQVYRRKYETFRDAAQAACRVLTSPQMRAQTILELMHREILTGGYEPSANQMSQLLDEGKFNCVSATVLFNALASDCSLSVQAIELPTHAYSIVTMGEQSLIIETTCPTWFKSPQLPQQSHEVAKNIVDGHEVSPAALVAIIYFNRGTEALGRHEFTAAISANLRALQLDPTNASARGNLLAALNNSALAQSGEGKYAESVALLDQGRRLDAEHQPFLLNRRHVYRLWIESLIAIGQRDEAAAVLVAARKGDQECPLWEAYAERTASSHAGL